MATKRKNIDPFQNHNFQSKFLVDWSLYILNELR